MRPRCDSRRTRLISQFGATSPGHTPGSMSFHVEGTPLLFTGDTFYAHMDEAAAKANPFFDGRVAHGYFIVSAAAGLCEHGRRGRVDAPTARRPATAAARSSAVTTPGSDIRSRIAALTRFGGASYTARIT